MVEELAGCYLLLEPNLYLLVDTIPRDEAAIVFEKFSCGIIGPDGPALGKTYD